jgi:hypothetical protein
MDLPGSNYLLVLATISITFAGFQPLQLYFGKYWVLACRNMRLYCFACSW